MPPEFSQVSDALLFGPFALGMKGHNIVQSTHLWREDVLDKTRVVSSVSDWPNAYRVWDERVVSVMNIWSYNYFHWVMEALPQLLALSDFEKIIVPVSISASDHMFPYIRESLQMLDLYDLAYPWDGVPTQVKELLSYGPVRVDGHNDPHSLAALHDRFCKMVGSTSERRIYISRSKATKRRVINEKTLIKYLKEIDFVVVRPEELTFEEQIRTFKNARVIIAPHGAGLTNMVWSHNPCKIIELFGSYHNPCYEKLAQDLDFQYESLFCSAIGDDLVVNFSHLENEL